MFDIDLSKYRIVDLSFEVRPEAPEPDRPFEIARGLLHDRTFKYDILRTHTHVGTHVEAPAHFYDGGKSITDLPLETYVGPAVLAAVDLPRATAITEDYLEQVIGDIMAPGRIVVTRDDRAARENGRPPHLTAAAAEWLVARGMKMLVLDTEMGADIEEGRALHDIIMSRDVPIVERLAHLGELRRREFYFMALPIKVRGLDSGWTRAIAIEER
jgi:kynurenine formamidase